MESDYSQQAFDLQTLKNFIKQESFLSAQGYSYPESAPQKFESVIVGTGIGNKEALSAHLPFDVLNLVLGAEKIRRTMNLKSVCHLIADTHATVNGFGLDAISKVSKRIKDTLEQIIERLGFDHYQIFTASEISKQPTYQNLFNSLQEVGEENPYERREICDIEFFRQKYNVGIKLGWAMNSPANFDETHFDEFYKSIYKHPLIYLYTPAGKRLSDRAPNAVPYTLFEGDYDVRFILSKGENPLQKLLAAKCSEPTKNNVINHYKRLLRVYRCFDKIPKSVGRTPEQINYVINKLLS